jgi:hypothetical protein
MKHADQDQKPRRRPAAGYAKGSTETGAPGGPAASAVLNAPVQGGAAIARGAFLALCTRSQGGSSEAVMYADNPVGGALLSTGLGALASAAAGALGPLMPVGTSGLNVNEVLHRLDANIYPPTLDRGVSGANRVGEVLGAITMRWLLAPEGFEATPSAAPPPTEIRSSQSQRFVMHDGVITFNDRSQGALRFFGAGRTYPATIDGQTRLLFAGTGVVVDGLGGLKGTRGSLAISGEIVRLSGIALTVVGRFDPDGPIGREDNLGPLFDVTGTETSTMVFTLAGSSLPGAAAERLTAVRIGNDVSNGTHLRSVLRAGSIVGTASGSIAFDPAEHRCAVPLAGMRRLLEFSDPAGRRIGTLTIDSLEGTSLREQYDGESVSRTVAYGAIANGTGAFSGVAGVVTLDAAAADAGGTSSLYVLYLADPDGRFRASFADVYKPVPPMASGVPPPVPADTLSFVDSCAATITPVDRTILRYAERTLADGMELARWWEAKDRAGDYAERFDVVREYNQSDRSFGFFDTAVIAGAGLPVMGVVQEMFYDRQKMASGETIRAQMQEFVLRYFMRVSHYRQPEAVAAGQRAPQSMLQRAMSWLPDEQERRVGFGYQQLYYKLRDSGKIGKFTSDEQGAIVDLREIGPVYDWIVLKVDIFDFNLSFAPFGADALKLQLPLKESTYLVLGPPFVKNVEQPEPGVLGQYGFGYAFVPYAPDPGMIAYGPGHFAAAIQTVDFKVMEDGEIRVRAAFVVNRPNKIANVDVAPLEWGFQLADMMTFNIASRLMSPMKTVAQRLPLRVNGVDPISAYIWVANTMTGGLAEKRFGISKSVLEKRMLVQHFMQHYEMLINSLLVWRTIPDWTDHERLPEYCRRGVTC